MTISPNDLFTNEELEDFASEFLGLRGTDTDMFYESYYNLNTDDQYEEDDYRDEVTGNYTY